MCICVCCCVCVLCLMCVPVSVSVCVGARAHVCVCVCVCLYASVLARVCVGVCVCRCQCVDVVSASAGLWLCTCVLLHARQQTSKEIACALARVPNNKQRRNCVCGHVAWALLLTCAHCLHPMCVSSRAHHRAHYITHRHSQPRTHIRALADVYFFNAALLHKMRHKLCHKLCR